MDYIRYCHPKDLEDEAEREKYMKKQKNEDPDVRFAYVVFRSMDAM